MAYIVVAYIVMAAGDLDGMGSTWTRLRLYSYGLYSYGLNSYGVYSHCLYTYGLCSSGLHSYGLYSYGQQSYGGFGWGGLDLDPSPPVVLLESPLRLQHIAIALRSCAHQCGIGNGELLLQNQTACEHACRRAHPHTRVRACARVRTYMHACVCAEMHACARAHTCMNKLEHEDARACTRARACTGACAPTRGTSR